MGYIRVLSSASKNQSGFEKLIRLSITKEFEVPVPSVPLPNGPHVLDVDGSFRTPTILQLGAVARTLKGVPIYARYCILDLEKMFPEELVDPSFIDKTVFNPVTCELTAGAYGVIVSKEQGLKDALVRTDSKAAQGMICSNPDNHFTQDVNKILGISCKSLLLPNTKAFYHIPNKANGVADQLSRLHRQARKGEKPATVKTIQQLLASEKPTFAGKSTYLFKKSKIKSYGVTEGFGFEKLESECSEFIFALLNRK